MKIEVNRGDMLMIQSEKETITVRVLQNSLLEITHLD